jgi:fructokinase
MRLGALEAGGTKMVCSIGDETGKIFDRATFPTLAPDKTMPPMIEYFQNADIEALGISSFGPLDLNPASSTYGYVTTTPKPDWGYYPLLPTFKSALGVPVGIDTDVGGAALAEYLMGAAKGLQNCVYVTVGTGIGAGVIAEGKLLHGMIHPEWGHILMRPHPQDPMPKGACPYHDGCLEGLASGPAIEKRWGISAKELPEDHIGWKIEAYYLAQLCVTALVTISTEKIVLGGGVMQKAFLFPMIRQQTLEFLNGYVAADAVLKHIDRLIVPPGLGIHSGVTGALLIAAAAGQTA